MGSRTARRTTTAAGLAVCARSRHNNMFNPERHPAVQHLTPPTDSRGSPCFEGGIRLPHGQASLRRFHIAKPKACRLVAT